MFYPHPHLSGRLPEDLHQETNPGCDAHVSLHTEFNFTWTFTAEFTVTQFFNFLKMSNKAHVVVLELAAFKGRSNVWKRTFTTPWQGIKVVARRICGKRNVKNVNLPITNEFDLTRRWNYKLYPAFQGGPKRRFSRDVKKKKCSFHEYGECNTDSAVVLKILSDWTPPSGQATNMKRSSVSFNRITIIACKLPVDVQNKKQNKIKSQFRHNFHWNTC